MTISSYWLTQAKTCHRTRRVALSLKLGHRDVSLQDQIASANYLSLFLAHTTRQKARLDWQGLCMSVCARYYLPSLSIQPQATVLTLSVWQCRLPQSVLACASIPGNSARILRFANALPPHQQALVCTRTPPHAFLCVCISLSSHRTCTQPYRAHTVRIIVVPQLT